MVEPRVSWSRIENNPGGNELPVARGDIFDQSNTMVRIQDTRQAKEEEKKSYRTRLLGSTGPFRMSLSGCER